MKKIIVTSLILIVIMISQNIYAGESKIRAKSMSLYLGLRNINEFGFDNFIGFQTVVQDSKAVWLEFGINSQNVKFDETDESTSLNAYHLGIGITYYLFHKNSVAAYISPEFSIGIANQKLANNEEIEIINYNGGLNIGLEWWALDNISLRASTFIGYSATDSTKSSKPKNIEVNSYDFGILANTKSKFLLSIYF